MEDELQGKVTVSQSLPRQAHSKRTVNLPPVDIYCIGASVVSNHLLIDQDY